MTQNVHSEEVAVLGVVSLHHVSDTTLNSPSLTAVFQSTLNPMLMRLLSSWKATITCLENKLEELRHDIQQKTLLG